MAKEEKKEGKKRQIDRCREEEEHADEDRTEKEGCKGEDEARNASKSLERTCIFIGEK